MALIENIKRRRTGAAATGGRKGTSNKDLMEVMPHIRNVADLERIRSAKTPDIIQHIMEPQERLESRRIVPRSSHAAESSVQVAVDTLQSEMCKRGGNQDLLKLLWNKQDNVPDLRPFIQLVIRLWLISPPESVVESMGSVIQEVFGAHRQLDHSNAAKELLIRWNGPELCRSDALVKAVQRKCGFNFLKRSGGVTGAIEGTVITRHRRVKCPRSAVYATSTQQS